MVIEKEYTCIICPRSCKIKAKMTDDTPPKFIEAEGYSCPRGLTWVKQEIEMPMRTFSTSVLVKNGDFIELSVRTARPVPLNKIFDVMAEIRKIKVKAPIAMGQIILKNPAGTDTDIIATREVHEK
ncbi:MAG: DUF1667 domain-containing protein [Synergistaceae bacterium]